MSNVKHQLIKIALTMLVALAGRPAMATVVFSDNFDSGSVAGWVKSTNYADNTDVTVRSDIFVSPNFALYTYLDAPRGGNNLFVHASHDFTAPVSGDYTLDLWGLSTACQGCTISYDVIVDGVLLDRKSAPTAFESRSFALTGLTAGTHVVTLGIFTDIAFSGRFNASFDDVVISSVASIPEPASYAMLLTGLGLLGLTSGVRRNRKS